MANSQFQTSGQASAATPQIGLVSCVAFGVGTTVGGGVFTLSGTAVNLAGPGAVLSYVIAGIVMTLCALSFIVVSTRAADGESGYGPVGTILSPFWRFIVMWAFYLNGATIVAYLVDSFGDYLHEYFLPAVGTLALALAATDPANPYGAALPWPKSSAPDDAPRHRPGRKAGGLVVLVDGALVLFIERGGRTMLTFDDDPGLLRSACASLAATVKRGGVDKIVVEKVDGASIHGHAFADILGESGFSATPRGYRLRF